LTDFINRIGCELKDVLEAVLLAKASSMNLPDGLGATNPERNQQQYSILGDEDDHELLFSFYQDSNLSSFNYRVSGSTKFKSMDYVSEI